MRQLDLRKSAVDPGRGGGMSPSDRIWRERGLRSAVLAGDERAWQTLYEETFSPLAAYVRWRCAGLHDLEEEIIQDTWLVATPQPGAETVLERRDQAEQVARAQRCRRSSSHRTTFCSQETTWPTGLQ